MPVMTFDARRGRATRVGERRYVLLRPPTGGPVKIESTCRHRGGPLDLGEIICGLDGTVTALRCPWHQRSQPLRPMLLEALPTVIRDGIHGAFILPSDAGDET